MDFATDYKDFITFLYYLLSFILQVIVFIGGTCYLTLRERKQNKRERDKEERKRELREWRQFSESINMEYIRLKSSGVLQRIQNLRDSLSQIRISRKFRGLDVLRYMIDDVQHFNSPELLELCFNLDAIFIQLNRCGSLCLLGEVPNQFIKGQSGRVVSELGELILPFLKEMRYNVVIECLRKFKSNPSRIQDNSWKLKQDAPYVKYLRFGGVVNQSFPTRRPLTLKVDALIFDITNADKKRKLQFLEKLNDDLNGDEWYAKRFVTKLRQKIEERSFRWKIDEKANNDEIMVDLLHEVRYYIWEGIENDYDTQLKHNIEQLREVHVEAENEANPLMARSVILSFKRLSQDLRQLLNSGYVDSDPALVSEKLIEVIERYYRELTPQKIILLTPPPPPPSEKPMDEFTFTSTPSEIPMDEFNPSEIPMDEFNPSEIPMDEFTVNSTPSEIPMDEFTFTSPPSESGLAYFYQE